MDANKQKLERLAVAAPLEVDVKDDCHELPWP